VVHVPLGAQGVSKVKS